MAIKSKTTKLANNLSLQIRDLARHTATYAILIALIAVVFFGVEFMVEKFLYSNDEVVDIISATIGAFVFSRFRSDFETWTDRVFFRAQYDYTEAVQALNIILRTTINLKQLLGSIATLLSETIKPEVVIFLLPDSHEPMVFQNPNALRQKLPAASGEKVIDGIAAAIPFLAKDGPMGTMLIGKKLSGGEIEAKDLQLLQTISQQAGMAIENAQLYEALREHSEALEKRVADKTERIKEMYDAQSKFLADIAHEFQTPIAILKGNLSLLAKGGAETKTGTRTSRRANALYVAITTLDRLSRLVDNLLDIAKLNFSKEKFRQHIVDVGLLLEEARDDCQVLAEDKNISIVLASDSAFVAGDKDRLKEVLLNLLSNALKHTPGGGTISLSARRDGENVEIVVADTGNGIAPENLSHIFERFYKIDRRGTIEAAGDGSASGNGIGLHLCRQTIEAHGGTIVAESEPGRGSRFVIHLPLVSRFAAAVNGGSPPTAAPTSPPPQTKVVI